MAFSTTQYTGFARIHPDSLEARQALHLVAADQYLHPHHRSFIHAELRAESDSSGSEANTFGERDRPSRQFFDAYCQLSIEDPVQTYSRGWVAGRGSADFRSAGEDGGVNLLLISPDANKTSRVALMHVGFWIEPSSGALMLCGAHHDRPVHDKISTHSPWVLLRNGQSHMMYQRCNAFSVGHLQFNLISTDFEGGDYEHFVAKRNASLKSYGYRALRPELSAVPRAGDVRRGHIVTQEVISRGAFRTTPGERRRMNAVLEEARIGNFFKNTFGLLTTVHLWCEHDADRVCGKLPYIVFISFPLARCDFSGVNWRTCPAPVMVKLFEDVLWGLVTIHGVIFMHRDITTKNLFVMSFDPPSAVIGDFGKAVESLTHRDTQIGPGISLAPKVNGNEYDKKIDIWSLGYAFLLVVWNRDTDTPLPQPHWYASGITFLEAKEKEAGLDGHVASLIRKMLDRDPTTRPAAHQILHSACFSQGESDQ
ncbi:MAG: hypothetical protein Q9170_007453 [Blastenia crenularia]